MKKSKKEKFDNEGSVSSSAPLFVVVEKAKKRRTLVKKNNFPPLPAQYVQPEESGSDSNEPLLKRLRKQVSEPDVEHVEVPTKVVPV